MSRNAVLTLALLGSLLIPTQTYAQVSVADIPALPLSGATQPNTPTAPSPTTPVTPRL
ncbi:hypothetical protein ACFP9V_15655 [Deinococcus radiopugnans]|uniref:hypothetical protein n=1 Tax=Deinococcus radiopugnans TaxID=57497 RepID=UPI003619629B